MNQAIGIALLESLWQGVWIAGALWIVLRLIPQRHAEVRYICGIASLSSMLLWFVATVAGVFAEPWSGVSAAGTRSPSSWPVWAWMAGVALTGGYRLTGWMLLARQIRLRAEPPFAEWRVALDRMRARLEMSGGVAVRRADWLAGPAVYGVLKPVVLIPAAAVAGLSTEQLEAILAHELAHVLRRDFLVNILQTAAETILFYHPAAWWISRQIRQERECSCDRIAARAAGGETVLAKALVSLEENRAAMPLLAASGGNLRNRIERLAELNRPAPVQFTGTLLALSLLAAVQLFGLQELTGGFAKWLREDVVYIIEDREERAFLALRTDEERVRFIEQFWLRRDPTPGTPENERKEEHYRRIGFALQRFGELESKTPGWKTDRGRIYIQTGPPDELEVHPSKGLEKWKYRGKDGAPDGFYEFQDGKLKSR